jgi:hypothetical protein
LPHGAAADASDDGEPHEPHHVLVGLPIRNPEFAFVVRAVRIAAFMVLTADGPRS